MLLLLKSALRDKNLFSNSNEAASRGFRILEWKKGVGLPVLSEKMDVRP